MFTFYSVSSILNSKVVLFLSHIYSLLLLCVLTAAGGYGDHRGSQKSSPACFGPWPVRSRFPPFNSTVWTHPAPALSPGGSIFRRGILDFLWRLVQL